MASSGLWAGSAWTGLLVFVLQVGVFEASGVVREAYLQGVVDDLLACAALTDGRYVAELHEPDGRPSISFCSCRSFSSFAAAAAWCQSFLLSVAK
jgi:hypothetical protein